MTSTIDEVKLIDVSLKELNATIEKFRYFPQSDSLEKELENLENVRKKLLEQRLEITNAKKLDELKKNLDDKKTIKMNTSTIDEVKLIDVSLKELNANIEKFCWIPPSDSIEIELEYLENVRKKLLELKLEITSAKKLDELKKNLDETRKQFLKCQEKLLEQENAKTNLENAFGYLETKKKPKVKSDVIPRYCQSPIKCFTLDIVDEPTFPHRSENYSDYEMTYQCYDDFRQALVISNNKIYLNRLEFRLTRLFQNRRFWHTDYKSCITKMRDNAMPYIDESNVERILLLTRFILEGR